MKCDLVLDSMLMCFNFTKTHKNIRISQFFLLFFSFVVDFLAKAVSPLHIWHDALTCLERQGYIVSLFCHLPPVGFDWPQHTPSNPCSTTNKSLSSDTIQLKVCSRSSARTLSVFSPYLFWFGIFCHDKIDVPFTQNRDCSLWCCSS